MTKFHINPTTGNPGRCTAADGNCRFGDISGHYASKDLAREAYEAIQNTTSLKAEISESQEIVSTPRLESGSLRLYKNISDRDLSVAASLAKTYFLRDNSVLKFKDRFASGLGVTALSFNKKTGEYSIILSRMQMQSTLFTSTDVREALKFAAKEIGYDDDEYDPIDWDA